MKGFRIILVLSVALALLLTACGRRLSDEPVAEVEPTSAPTEVAATDGEEAAEETAAEATEVAAEDVEATEEAAGEEVAAADEEPAVDESDPFAVRVAEADPANGETLFNQMTSTGFACSTCHLVDAEQMLVGPGLLGIPERAGTRVEGQSAPEYVYHSITAPNDYIVETYPVGVMPQTYTDVFTEDEIYDLAAYVLTLHDATAQQAEAEPTAAPVEETSEEAAVEEDSTEEAVVEEAAVEEDSTEEAATEEAAAEEAAAEEAATEEAAAEEAAAEEVVEEEPETAVVTQVVIVVTATPGAEVAAAEETSEEAAPVVSGEPDIVVTLTSLGIASYGEETFNREVFEGTSCATCHDVSTGEYIDGPSLVNVSELAAEAGKTPQRYVYDAIVNPEVHPDLEGEYASALSSAEIYDVVAYLVSMENADVEVEAAPEGDASAEEDAAAADGGEAQSEIAAAVSGADAAHGQELFNTMNSTGFACATCHYVDRTDMLVGPGMLGLADRAGERVEGEDAAEYLYNSILHPNDYVVESYPEMVMPQFYVDIYSEQEIYDIVAYLLTLTE